MCPRNRSEVAVYPFGSAESIWGNQVTLSYVTTMLETIAVKGGNIGREMACNLAESSDFHTTLGIFYMPQI